MYILVGYIHKVSQNFDIWNIFPNISWNSVFFGHFLPFSPKFWGEKSSEKLIFSGNIGLYWLKIGTTNLHSSLHLFPKVFFVKVIFSWNVFESNSENGNDTLESLLTNVKHVSSLDVHPGGDNIIIGSYDSRLSWFDLDLSTKPYKTLK